MGSCYSAVVVVPQLVARQRGFVYRSFDGCVAGA